MRIGSVFKTLSLYGFYVALTVGTLTVSASQTFQLENGEVLQDPTRPEVWTAPKAEQKAIEKEPTFELNYIVMSAGQKRASVNGKKVHEGDMVSGAKITRITSDSVHLSYKGQPKTLRMNTVNGIKRN